MRAPRRWTVLLVVLAAGCGGGGDTSQETGGGLSTSGPPAEQPEGSLGEATHAEAGQEEEEVLAGPAPITPETTQAAGDRPLPHCTDDTVTITAETRARAEASAVCIINKLRRRRGRRALQQNAQLYDAAHKHASDMVEGQYFSHVSKSGRSATTRMRSAGYGGGDSWQVGENIAWGSGGFSTPRAIVQSWMNSRGHRANILRRAYREAGLAIAVGAPVQSGLTAGTYVHNFGRQ
jgi:uncharacterized protein YkwD